MMTPKTAFMIAAPTSGSGKTTIARGLMALFTQKGYTVQPFKCGPDYIDTKFHEAVCGRPSINLDTFMASKEHVQALFARYGADVDICIVEGMMGLFDGYDRDKGSSAEIAATLGIPVVLVVDAKLAAYSMAALLSGFLHFRDDIHFAGVIYNKVGSERHFQMLRQVCDDLHVPCLGYLPKQASLEQGSRYLGLDFSEKAESTALVSLLEAHVNWQHLVGEAIPADAPTRSLSKLCGDGLTINRKAWKLHPLRVLIARNAESFSFIYQETIDQLDEVIFFDPEMDVPDLDGIDLLYLPGGYPEKHLEALVNNEACRRAIKDYAERGGRIIAECGGMMYLCRSIVGEASKLCNSSLQSLERVGSTAGMASPTTPQSSEASPTKEYPMCGVLPYIITARKADRKLSLGYRRFELDGREYLGHEFHYTQFIGQKPQSVTQVYNAKGEPVDTPVFKYKNVLASYTHLSMSPKLGDYRGLNNRSSSDPQPPN